MKIGTDAIILSSLTPKFSPQNILDIGTGCGIIALCLAQKYTNATILAIDIDQNSILEAKENFRNSKYSERISAQEINIKNFVQVNTQKFDLIVSNPPFFISSLESPKERRNKARHNVSLSYEDLILSTKNIISANGIFSLILPYKESIIFKNIACQQGFETIYREKIFSKPNKECERVVLHLKTNENNSQKLFSNNIVEQEIFLRDQNNNPTPQYNNLVKEFLL
ncbi:MAG: tRNA ((37)-N6)-methyltransferase TrmM [Bacteroidetes bacterium]|nr:tRNA ((37)-N6)-methyltransferase TrmM [Bacteroidota bacterium]